MRRIFQISLPVIMSFMIALLLCAYRSEESRKLHRAERLFDKDNSEAKAMLASVDTLGLSENDRNLWHLLQTRCHYFFNDPAFPDSVPTPTELAIIKEGDPDKLFELYFWKANRLYNRGRYDEAMICIEKCLRHIEDSSQSEQENDAIRAHSHGLKSHIWLKAGNLEESDRSNALSESYYVKTGKEMRQTKWNHLMKASLLIKKKRDAEALLILDSLRNSYSDTPSHAFNDLPKFLDTLDLTSLLPLFREKRVDEYRGIISRLANDSAVRNYPDFHAYKALLAYHDGDYENAEKELTEAWRLNNGVLNAFGDPMGLAELGKAINIKRGELEKALDKEKRISDYFRWKSENALPNSINKAINEYNLQLTAEAAIKERNARTVTLLIIIIAIILIGVTLIFSLIALRRHRERIALTVEELNNLRIKDADRRKSIHNLLSSRFEMLNRMCDDYFEMADLNDVTPLKNEIYKNLTVQLKEMRSEKFRRQLEQSVNTDLDRLMDRFSSLDNISKEDYNLFLYLASGFSIKAVGIFLDLKKSSVYSKRRRLREKIEASGHPDTTEFLDYL